LAQNSPRLRPIQPFQSIADIIMKRINLSLGRQRRKTSHNQLLSVGAKSAPADRIRRNRGRPTLEAVSAKRSRQFDGHIINSLSRWTGMGDRQVRDCGDDKQRLGYTSCPRLRYFSQSMPVFHVRLLQRPLQLSSRL